MSFASRLVERGVPLDHVSKLLGHSTILMTQRYSHASPTALAAAVAGLVGETDAPADDTRREAPPQEAPPDGKFPVDAQLAEEALSKPPRAAVK